MIDQLTNKYSLSKTLQFSLIPVGKTEENFHKKMLLEQDKKRAQDYEKVKEYIDRYHKHFIQDVLSSINSISGLNEYSLLYYKNNKSQDEEELMEKIESSMRSQIADAFASDPHFKDLFGEKLTDEILYEFISDPKEIEVLKNFNRFSTYFVGFRENRRNMYSAENQTTAISHRCINDNLPKFLDNIKAFSTIDDTIHEEISTMNDSFFELFGHNIQDYFCNDFFVFVLSQKGIDEYNSIIGGYSNSDGSKVKGINEFVNLYNQIFQKDSSFKKLPLLKPLYKQILSDREKISFIPDSFENDNEVLRAINEFYLRFKYNALKTFESIKKILDSADNSHIYLNTNYVSGYSNKFYGSWNVFSSSWNNEYDIGKISSQKNYEKYINERSKQYKKIKSISIFEFARLCNEISEKKIDFKCELSKSIEELCKDIDYTYNQSKNFFTNPYTFRKKLSQNDEAISVIKSLLELIKDLEKMVLPLMGTGKESDKDEVFYGEFESATLSFSDFDCLYDKVRNYITKKPYSKNKIKLNFENPQFLAGWDKNKEKDYRSVLLRKNGLYYLAIMDKANNKVFDEKNPLFSEAKQNTIQGCFEKIDYKLLPGPNKMLPKVFFAARNIDYFAPSDEILAIREKESFKKGKSFNINDCRKLIDFYKASISKHNDWSKFGFQFKNTEEYNDIGEFFYEVKEQGYGVNFVKVSDDYINKCVDLGHLYLFKIYCKDFSESSHGQPNLHTLYFKSLFDDKNLQNVVFRLNGGAEMFYRCASISDEEKIIHLAHNPIKNKNTNNPKTESLFNYDITKDKRFTVNQYSLHLPIEINFKANGEKYINESVRKLLKYGNNQHIIGIDRGERNLIYISVIDMKGNIVLQKSLNEILSDNNYKVDYHNLLDNKEKELMEARKSWTTIQNIKELKEGYMSQVVHIICQLVVKYDAVIALEDLNSGFKNSRKKVEKQVYQKFENMLIDKLNYYVDKRLKIDQIGGALNGYQLTNKNEGIQNGMQNGILFYIPAWLTSKIDPSTGFVDLIKPKYKSVQESIKLFSCFDDIKYNNDYDMFEFDIDYSKFDRGNTDYLQKWRVFSNGDRIKVFRNSEKNNEFDYKRVNLTEEFRRLFLKYQIDTNNIKCSICSQQNAEFFKELINTFALTLQMRNSIPNSTLAEDDYLISPVLNKNNEFYDSRKYIDSNDGQMPIDADANGAYNIARKVLWAIKILKETPDAELKTTKLSISNKEWLEFAQTNV